MLTCFIGELILNGRAKKKVSILAFLYTREFVKNSNSSIS